MDSPSLVGHIVAHFPERIGPEPGSQTAGWDEGDFSAHIKRPHTKIKSKCDFKPFGKGHSPTARRACQSKHFNQHA